MLKLLIIDDERIIRESLKNSIKWESYGIEVCGAKASGEEALELCRKEMPDIIVTDIKMSHMSGLDFIEQLGEEKKNCKIIILSGFDDFEFSKRALRNNVFEYLLKPVHPKIMIETVKRARDVLLKEREEEHKREKYIERVEKNLNIIRSHYFSGLICGAEYSEEETTEIMSMLKLDFSEEENLFVMALHISGVKSIIYYALFSEFQNNEQLCIFSGFDGKYGIFCRCGKKLKETVSEVLEKIERLCGSDVSIGVSMPFVGIKNLKKAWEEACLSLDYRDITGGSQIIYYNPEDNGLKMLEINEEKLDRNIVDAVDRLDKNAFRTLFEEFIAENPDIPIERLQRDICKTILSVCGYIIKIDEKPDKIIGDWRAISEQINSFKEFDVLIEFCVYIFSGVVDKIIDSKSLNSSPVVNKIAEYLEANYDKPFSLETIARNVYLSPNYVSTLFKRETGKKLSDYVVEVRVKKAKELLKNSSLKAYEIAEKVGYFDSRYFGELFKKITGVSLTEYRKSFQNPSKGV